MSDPSQVRSRIQVHILPSADENNDQETLNLVEDVCRDFQHDVSQRDTVSIEGTGNQTRGAGFIVLIPEIINTIITHKDLIVQIFQTSQVAIEALAKRRHVKMVELKLGDKSIRVEGANTDQVDRLINLFEAQYPGTVQQITSSSSVEVIGTVSKNE